MKWGGLIAALVGLLVVFVATGATRGPARNLAPKPSLQLLEREPLKVRGVRFEARERVTVVLVARPERTRNVDASATGSFVVDFGRVSIRRCTPLWVRASGSQGSRAVLKKLPPPACQPA